MGLSGAESDSFGYDDVGNLLIAAGKTFAYSLRNMVRTGLITGGGTTLYGYDGDDARAVRTGAAGTRLFVHGPGGAAAGRVRGVRGRRGAGARLRLRGHAHADGGAGGAHRRLRRRGERRARGPGRLHVGAGDAHDRLGMPDDVRGLRRLCDRQRHRPGRPRLHGESPGSFCFPEGVLRTRAQRSRSRCWSDPDGEGAETFTVSLADHRGRRSAWRPTRSRYGTTSYRPFPSPRRAPRFPRAGPGWHVGARREVRDEGRDSVDGRSRDAPVSLTADATATAGIDYQSASGTITFPTGTESGNGGADHARDRRRCRRRGR